MVKTAILVLLGLLPVVMGATLHCTSDSDCGSDECCTEQLVGRKRFLFGDSRGTCRPLAPEGSTCEPDIFGMGGSVPHTLGCPCAAGLECHGVTESHHGGSHSYTNPRCVLPGTSTGTGSGSETGSGSGNEGGIGPIVDPTPQPTEPQHHTADPNQPIAELPGK